jgi:NTE family protein
MEVNRLGGELRTDVRLSLSRHLATEWYQPMDTWRATFLSARAVTFYRVEDLYAGDTKVAEYRKQGYSVGVDGGAQFWRFGELRSGLQWGETDTDVRSGLEVFPARYHRRGAWVSRLRIDSLDDAHYPRSGLAARATFYVAREDLGDYDDYEKLSIDATQFFSYGRNTTFVSAAGGSNLGSAVPFDDHFAIGGPQSFSGFQPGQLRGQLFAVSRIGYYRVLVEGRVLFGSSLYAGAWAEAGNTWNSVDAVRAADVLYTGTVALGATTILGPVQIGYGRADVGYGSFFLTVGRQFGTAPGLDF